MLLKTIIRYTYVILYNTSNNYKNNLKTNTVSTTGSTREKKVYARLLTYLSAVLWSLKKPSDITGKIKFS